MKSVMANLLTLGPIALTISMLGAGTQMALVPWPQKVLEQEGSFELSAAVPVLAQGREAEEVARWFCRTLSSRSSLALSVVTGPIEDLPSVIFHIGDSGGKESAGNESYILEVGPGGIRLDAHTAAGLFYASQTLLQLISAAENPDGPKRLIRIGAVRIDDHPRFPWRGLMLDCSRTFQSLSYLRQTIDRLAAYKMNVLHLHLTDDQGWRLEIKRYPELTLKGARFPLHWNEPEEHQGFYSQSEIRELVAYAAFRNVTIVPEIEMPGHSLAALSCFPELSCSGGPFEIFPFFKGPNITEDILCAGKDATFEFLDNVLSEVIEIFPSPLIHVGGDEAPKARWKTCPHCQARMESEGLETEEQLQGYFLRRVEEMVSRHGRRLIGWTEIVDGGLGEEAAVMSWLGTRGAERASEAGHEVVMSPTSHCYFDYEYSKIDTRRAYSYEPVPEEFSARQATHILGLQANFWSHIDRTPDLVDRQLFPRLLAIAERGWSAGQLRDWDSFKERILPHLEALSRDGIQLYPDPSVYSEDAVQLP